MSDSVKVLKAAVVQAIVILTGKLFDKVTKRLKKKSK